MAASLDRVQWLIEGLQQTVAKIASDLSAAQYFEKAVVDLAQPGPGGTSTSASVAGIIGAVLSSASYLGFASFTFVMLAAHFWWTEKVTNDLFSLYL